MPGPLHQRLLGTCRQIELLDWLGHIARNSSATACLLVHGDPDALVALEPGVRALGLEPYRPTWHEEVYLDAF